MGIVRMAEIDLSGKPYCRTVDIGCRRRSRQHTCARIYYSHQRFDDSASPWAVLWR